MKHYKYGGSTAKRTLNCQAWRALSADLPKSEVSAAAKDGTCVHWLLEETILDPDFDMTKQVGKKVDDWPVTEEHIELAQQMWVATDELLKLYRVEEFEPEVTAEYSDIRGSTADLVASCYLPDGTPAGMVLDFKSGRGVQVEAEGNAQMLQNINDILHGSEAADLLDAAHFVTVIIQPDRSGEVQVKTAVVTMDQVQEFNFEYNAAIIAAENGDADPVAGDHCGFCPARGLCPATTGEMQRLLRLNPEKVSDLVDGLEMIERVKGHISAIEKLAFEQLERGVNVPGWKLVPKRATAKWESEEAVIKKLRRLAGGKSKIMTEKLVTPAEMKRRLIANGMEKSVAEERVEGLVVRQSSGNTLAHDDDPREAAPPAQALAAALASIQ